MDVTLIKEFEGCELKAYRDVVGVWTIGYGCTFYLDGSKVKQGDKLNSEAEAEQLLLHVIQQDFLPILCRIPTWDQMNSNQQAAVLSFAYNLGARFFANPGFESITRLLNNPEQWTNTAEVQRVFGLYVKAGGQTFPGLVRRRKAEVALFTKGSAHARPMMTSSQVSTAQRITALVDTWFKKDWSKQASELDDTERAFIPRGKSYPIQGFCESSLETEMGGHALVQLDHNAGEWYLFVEHWQLPWAQPFQMSTQKLPEWNQVNWKDWSSPVSRYFNVGEVTRQDWERIPTDATYQQNIIKIARCLDEVRQWWGSPLYVNSWYRPPHIERLVGGTGANHPFGFAVDFRPAKGSIWDLQHRFEREWYNTGKWNGGFGRGANRGFIHLDLRHQRIWDY